MRLKFRNQQRLAARISMPLTIGAFGALLWLERRSPLRRTVESKARREVGTYGLDQSGSGLVLRFPRVGFIHEDKSPEKRIIDNELLSKMD